MPTWLAVTAGLAVLLAGGQAFVHGSTGVARQLGLSPLLIGLTLVGFGTSLPELVTSVQAARVGAPGIAVGNVVGSNIANLLLIGGLAAVVTPIAVARTALWRDGGVMLAASLACAGVLATGVVTRWMGALLVLALVAYLIAAYRHERRAGPTAAHDAAADLPAARAIPHRLLAGVALAALGLAGVVAGADLLVTGAVAVARGAGLSEAAIGLTLVALGTSLPELAVSTIAAARGHTDVAVGNILGSNTFNLLGILGVTGAIAPIAVPASVARLDVWLMLGVSALFLALAASRAGVARWEGALLLLAYGGYLGVLIGVRG
ncbi:cation:H+ antiporter [Limimonas halophila]|uniref:Cation:H+ antiporter n=1 Tax=Limimonas halophila TaxID=1082479 RepID=A0A1G7V1L7_9PROT|nr:calcium/sodium antiporter [Limimonas halophila]SDG53617.1 cation:H+ antiporter [Limimonas halophila]